MKVLDQKESNGVYMPKARIICAILLNEKKEYKRAQLYLNQIIEGPYRGIYNIQAKNLLESYAGEQEK